MIVGREYEVKKLNEFYNSGNAELMIFYVSADACL